MSPPIVFTTRYDQHCLGTRTLPFVDPLLSPLPFSLLFPPSLPLLDLFLRSSPSPPLTGGGSIVFQHGVSVPCKAPPQIPMFPATLSRRFPLTFSQRKRKGLVSLWVPLPSQVPTFSRMPFGTGLQRNHPAFLPSQRVCFFFSSLISLST